MNSRETPYDVKELSTSTRNEINLAETAIVENQRQINAYFETSSIILP